MNEEARIPTHIWVMAGVRQSNQQGIPAMLRRRGEAMDGLVYLKISLLDGHAWVLTRQRDLDNRLTWVSVPRGEKLSEEDAESYLERAVQRDPDSWIIEVEDPQGAIPLHETVTPFAQKDSRPCQAECRRMKSAIRGLICSRQRRPLKMP
ncbi:DUF1491 family protein [Fodinicurvata halophila]|uniref:DUF1491 family protein n=1 Tax=Fodinicurvata halophila TaxID=1419723 RepID=UPI00363CA7CC